MKSAVLAYPLKLFVFSRPTMRFMDGGVSNITALRGWWCFSIKLCPPRGQRILHLSKEIQFASLAINMLMPMARGKSVVAATSLALFNPRSLQDKILTKPYAPAREAS